MIPYITFKRLCRQCYGKIYNSYSGMFSVIKKRGQVLFICYKAIVHPQTHLYTLCIHGQTVPLQPLAKTT